MKFDLKTGAGVATAVAMLLSSGVVKAADTKEKAGDDVKCSGINSCKGKGACAGADNTCSGKNGCSGKGWVKTSAKDCKDKKGTVVADAKK